MTKEPIKLKRLRVFLYELFILPQHKKLFMIIRLKQSVPIANATDETSAFLLIDEKFSRIKRKNNKDNIPTRLFRMMTKTFILN